VIYETAIICKHTVLVDSLFFMQDERMKVDMLKQGKTNLSNDLTVPINQYTILLSGISMSFR